MTIISIYGQEISKKENQFWELFDTQNIALLKEFNKNDFIKNNYWFYKHPVIEAIKSRNYILVDYLLSTGIKQTLEIDDRSGKDIIQIILSEKLDEGVIYILNKRKDVSNQVILSIIEQSKNIEILDILLKKIGNIDSFIGGYTLFIYSILNDNDIFTEYLIKIGCDLNMPYYTIKIGQLMYGETVVSLKTPLDLLIERNKNNIVEIMMKLNAKTFKQLVNENIDYGNYLSKIFFERKVFKFYTRDMTKLKEFPREKSLKLGTVSKNATVYIIDQSEKVLAGDHYSIWYLICTEDGKIGWVKNNQLYYPSYM